MNEKKRPGYGLKALSNGIGSGGGGGRGRGGGGEGERVEGKGG